MKERLLLLCMAYPEISRKYGVSVCMAGITETAEFRRVYPIPFEKFIRFGFHKREWIEYDIKEKGDYRKESYKIYPESLRHDFNVDYEQIRDICKEHVTTIEDLKAQWDDDRTSLGIIKPELMNISIKKRDITQKEISVKKQQMLNGKMIPLDLLEYTVHYHFNCGENCSTLHKCLCLDTEAGQLYRNVKKGTEDGDEIVAKMREKLFTWMKNRDLYFLMGTHSLHPKSWMIISLLYPPKERVIANTLDKWL